MKILHIDSSILGDQSVAANSRRQPWTGYATLPQRLKSFIAISLQLRFLTFPLGRVRGAVATKTPKP